MLCATDLSVGAEDPVSAFSWTPRRYRGIVKMRMARGAISIARNWVVHRHESVEEMMEEKVKPNAVPRG